MNPAQFDDGDSTVKFSNFYVPIEIIGKGSFGVVVSAIEIKTNKLRAVKILIKKSFKSNEILKIRLEAQILNSLKHKNIVRFKALHETDTRFLIAMGLVKGGNLEKYLKQLKSNNQKLSIKNAALIMKGILEAVSYIHSKGVVHRDLKPENILISNLDKLDSIKLADFGLSAKIEASSYEGNNLYQNCGTLLYMGPELVNKRLYSKPVDIWSCGIILYVLLVGEHPLYGGKETKEELGEKILNPEWNFPSEFDYLAKDLFLKLVKKEPSNRYLASQALCHPWITQTGGAIPLTSLEILKLSGTQKKIATALKLLMLKVYIEMKESSKIVVEKKKETSEKKDQKMPNSFSDMFSFELTQENKESMNRLGENKKNSFSQNLSKFNPQYMGSRKPVSKNVINQIQPKNQPKGSPKSVIFNSGTPRSRPLSKEKNFKINVIGPMKNISRNGSPGPNFRKSIDSSKTPDNMMTLFAGKTFEALPQNMPLNINEDKAILLPINFKSQTDNQILFVDHFGRYDPTQPKTPISAQFVKSTKKKK